MPKKPGSNTQGMNSLLPICLAPTPLQLIRLKNCLSGISLILEPFVRVRCNPLPQVSDARAEPACNGVLGIGRTQAIPSYVLLQPVERTPADPHGFRDASNATGEVSDSGATHLLGVVNDAWLLHRHGLDPDTIQVGRRIREVGDDVGELLGQVEQDRVVGPGVARALASVDFDE